MWRLSSLPWPWSLESPTAWYPASVLPREALAHCRQSFMTSPWTPLSLKSSNLHQPWNSEYFKEPIIALWQICWDLSWAAHWSLDPLPCCPHWHLNTKSQALRPPLLWPPLLQPPGCCWKLLCIYFSLLSFKTQSYLSAATSSCREALFFCVITLWIYLESAAPWKNTLFLGSSPVDVLHRKLLIMETKPGLLETAAPRGLLSPSPLLGWRVGLKSDGVFQPGVAETTQTFLPWLRYPHS